MNLLTLLPLIIATNCIEVKEVHEEVDERIPDAGSNLSVNTSYAQPTDELQVRDMARITAPSYYQTQVEVSEQNVSASTPSSIETKNETFNPSPEIPSDYEYNKYPVIPAFPEAKQAVTSTPDLRTYLPPAPVPILQNFQFPTNTAKYLPPKVQMNYERDRNHVKTFDQPYPFHSVMNSGKGYGHLTGPGEHSKHAAFPWKKVIHFITTLLPIGLFLTALTPSVLTITPVVNNETSKSSRLVDVDDSLVELLEGRAEDTTGCHQTRLLCIAAAKGNDPGATNLQKALFLIASQAYEETRGPKEFMNLFQAIKSNKCAQMIKCNSETGFKNDRKL